MKPPMKPIDILPEVMTLVFREARKAFPAECCGWLTGPKDSALVDAMRPCVNAQEQGSHPMATAAERSADTAYVIEGADLIAFNKAFSSATPPRIIYHSHPNGRAYFSATDQAVAQSPWGDGPAYDVQHLVVGIDAERVVEAALFGWSDEANQYVEIARTGGDDTI